MRVPLFAALLLSCSTANAQFVYKCPQSYPANDKPAAPLTNATMAWGEFHGNGLFAGDYSEAAQEGYDLRYGFVGDEQAWLICGYGGKKRVKGRFHDGHEWNQRMEWGTTEWWVKIAPKVQACNIQVREIKTHDPSKSTWTVTATCEQAP
jgi:hypothetical protein